MTIGDLTRPIIGIENRTAAEVFDIMCDRIRCAHPAPPAPVAVPDELEEAIRLTEVGEFLFNACRYSGGDGYTEPLEFGIEWQWQQSAPNQYGEGMLLAASTRWHDVQAEVGTITEARKLRAMLSATPIPPRRQGELIDDEANRV